MLKTARLIDLEIDETTCASTLGNPKALEQATSKCRVEVDRAIIFARSNLQTGSIDPRLILSYVSETDRRSSDR